MSTPRVKRLQNLTMSLTGQNEQVAQQQQQARDVGIQQYVQQTPQAAPPQAIQQVGAQAAGQATAIQTQQKQADQQVVQGMQKEGMRQQETSQKQKQFQTSISLSKEQMQGAERLARIDSRLKTELLDEQLQFQTDRQGKLLFTERQLSDWAATKATNREEFMGYQQQVEQTLARKSQMMETAHKKITQTLQLGYLANKQALDNDARKKLMIAKTNLEKKMRQEEANRKNRMSNWTAAGTIVGSIVGGVIGIPGGPAGIAAGAQIGGSLGGGAGATAGRERER